MTTCSACGLSLDAFDHFCRSCGHRAVEAVELEFETEPGDGAADHSSRAQTLLVPPTESKQDRTGVRQAVGLAIGVLLLGVIAVTAIRTEPAQEADALTSDHPAVPQEQMLDDTPPPDSQQAVGQPAEVTDPAAFVGIAPDAVSPVESSMLAELDLGSDVFALIESPHRVSLTDMATGERTAWDVPEPLVVEEPVAIDGSIVVVGETFAWARSVVPPQTSATAHDEPDWRKLGRSDRVRFSTKPDRVWLRSVNIKSNPTDADYLWNEVDLAGHVHRTMYRNRELHFPTPELVSGIGGDIFRLTDAEINAWRIFSPYGVIVATGHHDLVVKECNSKLECERVWYDTSTGLPREPIYMDLAQNIDSSYGARLSLDGRFTYREKASSVSDGSDIATSTTGLGGVEIRSVVDGREIQNTCRWLSAVAWTSSSEAFVCGSERGIELIETRSGESLGTFSNSSEEQRFVFVPTS